MRESTRAAELSDRTDMKKQQCRGNLRWSFELFRVDAGQMLALPRAVWAVLAEDVVFLKKNVEGSDF